NRHCEPRSLGQVHPRGAQQSSQQALSPYQVFFQNKPHMRHINSFLTSMPLGIQVYEGGLRNTPMDAKFVAWDFFSDISCDSSAMRCVSHFFAARLPNRFAISKSTKSAWWKMIDSIERSTLSPSLLCVAMMCSTSPGIPCLFARATPLNGRRNCSPNLP